MLLKCLGTIRRQATIVLHEILTTVHDKKARKYVKRLSANSDRFFLHQSINQSINIFAKTWENKLNNTPNGTKRAGQQGQPGQ